MQLWRWINVRCGPSFRAGPFLQPGPFSTACSLPSESLALFVRRAALAACCRGRPKVSACLHSDLICEPNRVARHTHTHNLSLTLSFLPGNLGFELRLCALLLLKLSPKLGDPLVNIRCRLLVSRLFLPAALLREQLQRGGLRAGFSVGQLFSVLGGQVEERSRRTSHRDGKRGSGNCCDDMVQEEGIGLRKITSPCLDAMVERRGELTAGDSAALWEREARRSPTGCGDGSSWLLLVRFFCSQGWGWGRGRVR